MAWAYNTVKPSNSFSDGPQSASSESDAIYLNLLPFTFRKTGSLGVGDVITDVLYCLCCEPTPLGQPQGVPVYLHNSFTRLVHYVRVRVNFV